MDVLVSMLSLCDKLQALNKMLAKIAFIAVKPVDPIAYPEDSMAERRALKRFISASRNCISFHT